MVCAVSVSPVSPVEAPSSVPVLSSVLEVVPSPEVELPVSLPQPLSANVIDIVSAMAMLNTRSICFFMNSHLLFVYFIFGSSASRTPSPIKLKPMTTKMMQMPGGIQTHGRAVSTSRFCAAKIMLPQEACGV